jgi:hypothetical protein
MFSSHGDEVLGADVAKEDFSRTFKLGHLA